VTERRARNVGPMMASERCGARTRAGGACRSPAVSGRRRCRMHGGAKGSGAPRGNQNALKSGLYTAESLAMRRRVSQFIRTSREIIEKI
jgi:hypothetical protein